MAKIKASAGSSKNGKSITPTGSRCARIAKDGINSIGDLDLAARAFVEDIMMGSITPDHANSIKALGNLTKIAEMQIKYSRPGKGRAVAPLIANLPRKQASLPN